MATLSQFRCAVDGVEALHALRVLPLPLGLRADEPVRSFHRDIYLDTSDRSLALRAVSCRLRIQADDRRSLCLILGGAPGRPPERWEAAVEDLDPRRALEGTTEPARRLRGLVDPELLRPRIEIETERWTRVVRGGLLRRRPRFGFLYDACTVRHTGLTRDFQELQVRRLAPGGPHLDQIAARLERDHGLVPLLLPKYERAAQLVEAIAAEGTARLLASQRAVALLAIDEGAIAFEREEGSLSLPAARGSGHDTCRHLLRRLFDSSVGELTLLGHVSATADRPSLEVWVARRIRVDPDAGVAGVEWLTLPEALARVGTPEMRSPETLGALALAARADVGEADGLAPGLDGWTDGRTDGRADRRGEGVSGAVAESASPRLSGRVETDAPAHHFLNVELSQLAFHERVLDLAIDAGIPLAERFRYLAILASNLDEFFSVRVGALKVAIAADSRRRTFDGLSAAEQFDAIAARVPRLVTRASRCFRECLAQAASRGLRVRRWAELGRPVQEELTRHFTTELLPLITPRAMTMSPGHPFPVIPQLALAFGVLVRDVHTGPVHFAYLAIPSRVPRFLPVPGADGELVPVEDVVRAHLQAFYPGRPVAEAWLFRVTRGADLDVNEEEAGDFLQAIEEEVQRRVINAPVRIEVERGFPGTMRDLLVRELRFERRGALVPLGDQDVYEADDLLDLTAARRLAERLPPADSFPPVTPRRPLPHGPSIFDLIDAEDRLLHHPYEDFDSTVSRFFDEAAQDPLVVAIKVTLYRVGDRSPVVDRLAEAARQGKDVAVFVELRARFDETRNVRWVRQLEEAGAQVIYGLVGYKNHAKAALVVRQTPDGVRRYAHIGTGNYNAGTARAYTDLGLLTADADITADLMDLFNQLTGTSGPPAGRFRRLLVAPTGIVPALLERIAREIGHVESGAGGRIRMQINGLEDPEIIEALYRASDAGVEIDLIVRGLCLLRPGVPGLSDRIRVRSVLGRFLEHQRIFHFGNGGADEYLIGSADLRPRNLRRRIEVLTPVRHAPLAGRLDRILKAMLEEPSAWILDADGGYRRGAAADVGAHVHARLMA